MVSHGSNESTDTAQREQAHLFVTQLEEWATRLEQQVTVLENTARMRDARAGARLMSDARRRRLELYEVRNHIDALLRRYPPTASVT